MPEICLSWIKTTHTMKRLFRYLGPVLLCFAVGFSASLFQARAIAEWYPALVKPPLTPPAVAFPIAWSIIYLCMGIALGVALDRQRRELILPWAVQLALNFLWSILFFTLRCPPAGLVGLLLLDAAVILFTCRAARSCRPAAWLFAPYLAWLAAATYLNLAIWLLNA